MDVFQAMAPLLGYFIRIKASTIISNDHTKVGFGRVKHHLISGLDYTQFRSHSANRYSLNQPELDLFNPNYGAMEKLMYDSPEISSMEEETYGVYIQDHIKLPGQVTLTLGGRYDRLESEGLRDQAFTPRAGVTYEVRPGWTAYINYSESFRPQGGMYDQNGDPLQPESGENWGTGLKFNLFEEKWIGLISIYQLTQQNIAISNLNTADPFYAPPRASSVLGDSNLKHRQNSRPACSSA